MAHKSKEAAIKDLLKQAENPGYRFLIVWKKDLLAWPNFVEEASQKLENSGYKIYSTNDRRLITKNQIVVGEKKNA